MRILYVQEEKTTARSVTLAMQREGVVILTADNIEVAKERVRFDSFDFLMLDLDLKNCNPFEFYNSIKESLKVPVLLITEEIIDDNILDSMNLNKNNILIKPISVKGILKALDKLAVKSRVHQC